MKKYSMSNLTKLDKRYGNYYTLNSITSFQHNKNKETINFLINLEQIHPLYFERFTELFPEECVYYIYHSIISYNLYNRYKENTNFKDIDNGKSSEQSREYSFDNRTGYQFLFQYISNAIMESIVQVVYEAAGYTVIKNSEEDFLFNKKYIPSAKPDLKVINREGEVTYLEVKYTDTVNQNFLNRSIKKYEDFNKLQEHFYLIGCFGLKENDVKTYVKYNADIISVVIKDNNLEFIIVNIKDFIDNNKYIIDVLYEFKGFNKKGYFFPVNSFTKQKLIFNCRPTIAFVDGDKEYKFIKDCYTHLYLNLNENNEIEVIEKGKFKNIYKSLSCYDYNLLRFI